MNKDMNKKSNLDVIEATLNMFGAIPYSKLSDLLLDFAKMDQKKNPTWVNFKQHLEQHFIVLTSDGYLVQNLPVEVYDIVNRYYGFSNKTFNQALHKSFKTVNEMSAEDYYGTQLLHYFSTYGLEALGFKSTPYVPLEVLNISAEGLQDNDKVRIIWILNEEEVYEKVENYFKTTERPSASAVDFSLPLLLCYTDRLAPEDIKSFELTSMWCKYHNVMPKDPTTFLRYLIYAYCGKRTLLIKNKELIDSIKYFGKQSLNSNKDVQKDFTHADLKALASIFLRYKPIFLAFKSFPGCAPYINKIRRLAVHYHKPLNDVNVRNISNLAKQGRFADVDKVLKSADLRSLIKLFNFAYAGLKPSTGWESSAMRALLNKTVANSLDADLQANIKNIKLINKGSFPVAYNIRNGKVFIASDNNIFNSAANVKLVEKVFIAINERVANKMKDKIVLVPEGLNYAAPYSEKQMVNTIPWGSYINLNGESGHSIGIHWLNSSTKDLRDVRVDIDLHMSGAEGTNIGWNANYKGNRETIIYSGDMTSAPIGQGGAVESIYFHNLHEIFKVSVNLYSGDNVPFQFFVADHKYNDPHVVDVNQLYMMPINLRFSANQFSMNLGIVDNEKFYFFNGSTDFHKRIPNRNLTSEFIQAIRHKLNHQIGMAELLLMAGAKIEYIPKDGNIDGIVNEENIDNVISLLPEDLTLTSFFEIIDNLDK